VLKFYCVARDKGEDDYDVFAPAAGRLAEVEEWCRRRLPYWWPDVGQAVIAPKVS
jgi:hypothetical protein